MSSALAAKAVIGASSTIYLAMDVHKESITIAVLPEGAKAPVRVDRLSADLVKLRRFLDRIAHARRRAKLATSALHFRLDGRGRHRASAGQSQRGIRGDVECRAQALDNHQWRS